MTNKIINGIIVLSMTCMSSTAFSKEFVIGMSQSNLGEPWRAQMNADIKKSCRGSWL